MREVGLDITHNRILAKFGYRSESKVKKSKNRATFWGHARADCLTVAISKRILICDDFEPL